MAPPSQKGRFKPRKPAKKIAAPSASLPDAAPSSAAAAARPQRSAGRGRGRGGRSGRGRGRAPLPRGQVFFTGDEKKADARNQDGTEQRGHKRSAIRNDEEIVATLEGGVGSTERKVDPNLASQSSDNKPAFGLFDDAEPNIGTGPIYYDSDSTAEEEKQKKRERNRKIHPESKPITLPYTGDRSQQETSISSKLTEQSESSDEWFLVQLPTRLPKVALQVSDEPEKDDNAEDGIPGGGMSQTALVATKPVLETAFDNSLVNAKPGRFGKIKVYKSGRSELVLSNGVKLDLVEGLTCSFEQHAVSIDVDEGAFVPFGKVKMTVTATPNVNERAAWGE